ncbi:MAG: hypothetical protein NWE95_07200, partial [Candidatus Bathyarchaeota archaeon]|nr:hypothetical protein [Candidatus Bathyarchaeota archaeon]
MKAINTTIMIALLLAVPLVLSLPPSEAAEETLLWQGTAYSDTGAPVTTPTLEFGQSYRIVVHYRFWYNQAGMVQADAQYYTTDTAGSNITNWTNYFPAPDGHSFLQINGGDVNWGPFSNSDMNHTYSITYIGTGAPITFQIVDWIDHDYSNNWSHLDITIYRDTSAAKFPVDFMAVNGVLSSDYYTLYPYETNADLKIGFSKYGELINSDANVGLEYGAVDPFAPPAGSGTTTQVPKRMWVQGWFLNITYYHRTLGWRNVWAMAIHSDSVVYGNDWIRVDFT